MRPFALGLWAVGFALADGIWFVPLLNLLPREHRFALGDRLVAGLYDLS